MCVSCTESILLWGLSADPPIVSVRNALAEAGSHVIFLDQRAVGDTEVELVVGTSVEGLLRAGRESFDLAAVKAVYLRPHENASRLALQVQVSIANYGGTLRLLKTSCFHGPN